MDLGERALDMKTEWLEINTHTLITDKKIKVFQKSKHKLNFRFELNQAVIRKKISLST